MPDHCADCFKGFVHDGIPAGEVSTIHGLRVYVARPDDGVKPKGLIVMIHDAFGMEFVNNKILADRYAKRGGYLVYLPDFMDGHAMSPEVMTLMDKLFLSSSWLTTLLYKPIYCAQLMYHVIPWKRNVTHAVSHTRVFSFFQKLRTSPPPFATNSLKIAAAGFCWGGKYTVLLAQDTPSSRVPRFSEDSTSHASATPEALIECGFTAHPSMLEVPGDIEAVTLPLSIAVGDSDMALKGPLVLQTKEILEKKDVGHEVNILPGAKHGFSIRPNPEDELQMEYAEKAEVQALAWFGKWLA
ncbi:hypothetical protein BP5796_07585 [Coleophoma crateriformis]|uniref:Dienelactone hydrolase domain-containing protein n=1 Tax=Coleophoma crateriformis TaxID=565419 RepID=A0A3D8RJB9_9HELO|nr:hypothetical protein BP5796_07585 [Coleophoma crateriformis]